MLITFILSILISNAVTLKRDMAILYNRIAIISLIYCILQSFVCFTVLSKAGVGLDGGLFDVTTTTQVFHIFHVYIYIISVLILEFLFLVLALAQFIYKNDVIILKIRFVLILIPLICYYINESYVSTRKGIFIFLFCIFMWIVTFNFILINSRVNNGTFLYRVKAII